MSKLLLELFSEEIPALMQKNVENAYLDIFTKIFEENEISANIQIFVGPRRITAHITHLPEYIFSKEIEIKGPKVEAPQSAIDGFCQAHKTSTLHLSTKLINDHLYYFYIKKTEERNIKTVLPTILLEAINKYVWPKSMYWGDYDIKWIRPLRNILCIFNGEILPLKFGHLTANNITYSHRLAGNEPLTINDMLDYKKKLAENHVIIDRKERQGIIKEQLQKITSSYKLFLKEDEKLLEEVTGLVEFPLTLIGKIPEKFLKLPKEVLVSSMRTHQKYFSLFDQEGNFAPYFLFVANGKFNEPDLIIHGNEKVLSARLSDALYFYEQDLSETLEARLTKLEAVTFHEKLGNLLQKTKRIEKICYKLAPKNKPLQLAAQFCKNDLVSQMVGEFPELQAIMGYYYALNAEIDENAALAIKDHYKPQGPGDQVPNGNAALLAIADKLDSLVGLMLAGETPTGSGDPYALRRQALGIIRVILENNLQINIKELIIFAANLYEDFLEKNIEGIINFFEDRVRFYFKNYSPISVISAVLDLSNEDNLVITELKIQALEKFLLSNEGEKLLTIYKRANNILENKKIPGEIDPNILTSKYEQELFSLTVDLSDKIDQSILRKDFTQSLNLLASMLDSLTSFFDNIMVNDENPKIANNRLLLLQKICSYFHKIAKFELL